MLYGVKSNVSFSHLHWDHGHAYLICTIWSGKETTPWTTTTAFSLDFFFYIFASFCILYSLLLFLLWTKNRSDVKWLLFLIFSRILVQMNANKFFREFLRNPGIFWLGQENTGNFETKNNLKGRDNNDRSRKATKPHEYVRRRQNEKQKYVPLF